ncbi:GHKL domain-containing protein [Marinilabiliaceae bacterium JC017]|nr:GHKL domain-containing protein [Marinilabiliaceae bacterium JC017]
MDKLSELKQQLTKELQSEKINNDKILKLSNKIASLDYDKIRFSIDAGVIDRLGRELVARQETAVSELVKNSYDADATEVKLTFSNSDIIGGTLSIVDDGDGMTREELVNGFMRISSTSKIHNPVSNKYKRIRAGKKGIGRFAVQRLGRKLTIITQTVQSDNALKLSINWDDYKSDIDLLSVSNNLEIIPKRKEKGTQLIIGNLRDKWTKGAIKRIYKYVSDIIQPFSLSENRKLEVDNNRRLNNDPGFDSEFYKKRKDDTVEKIADNKTEIFQHAVAEFNGYIADDGKGIYSIESQMYEIDETGEIGKDPDNKEIPFDKLQNIHFRAYYFLIDTDHIQKLHITHIRQFLKSNGSIRLYRNGFRVLPYGEPKDDWLNLDASARTRTILPAHGNNSFYGLVEMTDKEDVFTETSSREGLADSEELNQLRNFIYRTLITGVIKVAEKRNTKITTSQQKDESGEWGKTELRIQNIFKSIEELDQELDNVSNKTEAKRRRKKRVKKIKEEIKELQDVQQSDKSKYIKERAMLRVLSSVGLSIAQFIHEIKYYIENINNDIEFLLKRLDQESEEFKTALILKNNFSSFHTYTSYFDNVVSQNVIRELIPINMESMIKDFETSIKNEANRSGIVIEESGFPIYRVFTKPMHPSEWSSILFNFYTNSKKAIKRAKANGKIFIETGKEDGMVYLEFSDNGDGISKEIENQIFDEFFTTTTSSDFNTLNSTTEVLGTGLGLKIVKDIVKSYRGNIEVVSPKNDFSTTIRIEIPCATDKDYETYDL